MTAVLTPGSSGRIVVSHAPADAQLAASICARLEERGVRCWLASRDAPTGSAGVVARAVALEDATAILALLSEAANESADVRRELETGFSARRPLLALSTGAALPDGPLRYYLGHTRAFELAALEELAGALRRYLRVEALPRPATALVGRRRELSELVELLHGPTTRLITLTGTGGTGKTRLALEAARALAPVVEEGARWASLAPLRDPGLALSAIAHALELEEQPGEELLDSLSERLANRDLLLVLDNAEHLLPALARDVSVLASRCPHSRLLLTSRERLNVQSEHAYPVPSLAEGDAIELFRARAQAIGVELEPSDALAELCDRLDRLPLALELAAARTPLFTPAQLLERLGERLDLLRGGRDVDPRQQTLRATIDWSYDLLTPDEQRVFRAISVFAGGCSYEAAEAVTGAGADLLQSLLEKSLLRTRDTPRGRRYWMLETIREYAAERLEPEAHAVREKHASYYCGVAIDSEPALEGASMAATVARLTEDSENLHEAVASAVELDPISTLRAGSALRQFLQYRLELSRRVSELMEAALDAAPDAPVEVRASALHTIGTVAYFRYELEAAERLLRQAADLWRELGHRSRLARTLNNLGAVALGRADRSAARAYFEEANDARRGLGETFLYAQTLGNLGSICVDDGDFAAARRILGEALELLRESPASRLIQLVHLGIVELCEGNTDRARDVAREALELGEELESDQHLVLARFLSARCELRSGNLDSSRQLLLANVDHHQRDHDDFSAEETLSACAAYAAARGSFRESLEILGAAGELGDIDTACERIWRAELLVAVSTTLEQAEIDRLLDAGRKLDRPQALELARRVLAETAVRT